MSNLLVQNIKHTNNTTAQTIDTSGRTTISIMNNDSTNRSDGGAVTQNLIQGLAKHWVMFDGSGTPAIQDSLNSASLVDNGTGDYATNLTNNMSNSNYGYSLATGGNDIDLWGMASPSRSTSQIENVTKYHQNGSNAVNVADRTSMSSTIHGDLA